MKLAWRYYDFAFYPDNYHKRGRTRGQKQALFILLYLIQKNKETNFYIFIIKWGLC